MNATHPAPLPNSLRARDARVVLHPYTNAPANERDGPMVIVRGEGVRVWDEDGTEYIEAMAGLWCASLGFGNKRLAAAAAAQIETLGFYHGFSQRSHDRQIELAEKLLALAPVPMSKVFFANSGSEAADTAIKLVWYLNNALGRPAKKKIIGRVRGYHGVTIAAASVTGTPINHAGFDIPVSGRFLHTDCPHFYRYGADGENEEDFATSCAESLDALILREGPETVAAFFAEPVMGAGGVLLPPKTYFEKIQAVLKRHDVLLVADEVICGFGRTGKMWGSETYDLKPDILTAAKALTGGFQPISAIMVDEAVYRAIAKGTDDTGVLGHGFTYSGHPVAAAVALETLKIYAEMDLIGRLAQIAPRFQAGLQRFADHPLVGEACGVGLVGAVELVADKAAKTAFDAKLKVGPKLVSVAEAYGLIVRAMGDRIAFSPPLIIEPAEIDELFRRFALALDDTFAWVRQIG